MGPRGSSGSLAAPSWRASSSIAPGLKRVSSRRGSEPGLEGGVGLEPLLEFFGRDAEPFGSFLKRQVSRGHEAASRVGGPGDKVRDGPERTALT